METPVRPRFARYARSARHNPAFGIMTKLVQRRAVPIDGLEIRLWPRHLYEIMSWTVEGAVTADAEVGAGRGDQRFGVGQDEAIGHRCRCAGQFRRKALALIGVEHREPLEKWNIGVSFNSNRRQLTVTRRAQRVRKVRSQDDQK
jgi:hypothetical protein